MEIAAAVGINLNEFSNSKKRKVQKRNATAKVESHSNRKMEGFFLCSCSVSQSGIKLNIDSSSNDLALAIWRRGL